MAGGGVAAYFFPSYSITKSKKKKEERKEYLNILAILAYFEYHVTLASSSEGGKLFL